MIIRKFDRSKDIPQLCGLLYSAMLTTSNEDLSEWVDVPTLGDVIIPMQAAEARLYWYLHSGFEIMVAEDDNELVGFLVFHPIFTHMIAIRIMYLEPEFRGKKIAFQLVDKIEPRPKKVFFQTHRAIEPKECLEVTEIQREHVMTDEKMITWQMNWG